MMKYEGSITDGFMDGEGILFYKGSDKADPGAEYYEGYFHLGQREGKGTYQYANGTIYEGDWRADMPEGEGFCRFDNGNQYQGEWTAGKMNGLGRLQFGDSGDVYVGRFVDNCMDGYGEYYHGTKKGGKKDTDGDDDEAVGVADPATCQDFYKGSWKHDLRDGRGVLSMVTEDGRVETYDGEWKEGQIHGKGKYTFSDGKILDGEWRDGSFGGRFKEETPEQQRRANDQVKQSIAEMKKPQQKELLKALKTDIEDPGDRGLWGTITYPQQTDESEDDQPPDEKVKEYKGEILDEQPSGYGTQTFINGDTYSGLFKNGKPYGIGIKRYQNGSSYTGHWENGKMSGWGRFDYPGGEYYDGFWKDGYAEGYGEHFYKDDKGRSFRYQGLWHEDAKDTSKSDKGQAFARDAYNNERPRGRMEITEPSGEVSSYEGEWCKGVIHGMGVLITGGFRIEGQWDNGMVTSSAKVESMSNSIWATDL